MRSRNMMSFHSIARSVYQVCIAALSLLVVYSSFDSSFAQTPKGSTIIHRDASVKSLLTVGGLGGLTSNRSCSSDQYVDAILSDNLNCSPLYNAIQPNNVNGNYFECPSSQGIIGFQTVGNVLQPICGSCTGTGNCTSFSPGFKESKCDAPKSNKFYTYPIIDNTNTADIKIYCGCACGPGSVVSASPPGTTYPPNSTRNLFSSSSPPGYSSPDGSYIESLCQNACKTQCCTDSCSVPTPTPGCVLENGFQTFSGCNGTKTFAATIFTDPNTCNKFCNCAEAPLGFPDIATTYLPSPFPPYGFATTDLQSCLASCSASPPCNPPPPNTGTGTGTATGTSTGTGTGCQPQMSDLKFSCPPPKVPKNDPNDPPPPTAIYSKDCNGDQWCSICDNFQCYIPKTVKSQAECQQLLKDYVDGKISGTGEPISPPQSKVDQFCKDLPPPTPTPSDPCPCRITEFKTPAEAPLQPNPPVPQPPLATCSGKCPDGRKIGTLGWSSANPPPSASDLCKAALALACGGKCSSMTVGNNGSGGISGQYQACFEGNLPGGGDPTPTPGGSPTHGNGGFTM